MFRFKILTDEGDVLHSSDLYSSAAIAFLVAEIEAHESGGMLYKVYDYSGTEVKLSDEDMVKMTNLYNLIYSSLNPSEND